jgi:small-conductance mechanosensitive channel
VIDWLNDNTPLGPPFARVVLVAALLVVALLLVRASGRVAAFLMRRTEARHARGEIQDTGAITDLRQRETAISLTQTGVRYAAVVLVLVLAVVVLAGAKRAEAIVGVSFLALLLGFASQRLLADLIAGLVMFFDGWVHVGDTVIVEPWKVEGVVEEFSVRALTIRSASGEIMRVHNSQVLALRTVPRGVRSVEIELFVSDAERGADLVFEVARIVPRGPTQFVRVPAVTDVEELDPELVRIRLRAAVPPGREWLAESLFGAIARERAPEGLILHGPVVTIVDEQATRESAWGTRARW